MPPTHPTNTSSLDTNRCTDTAELLQALSWWALQFSPRVCVMELTVLLEVQNSARLFGGEQALLSQVRCDFLLWLKEHKTFIDIAIKPDSTPVLMACASTALAALAWLKMRAASVNPGDARRETDNGASLLPASLDALPIETLAATWPHHVTLQQLGCRTLGQLRRLPRGGVSRRFGAPLLDALDRAYGLKAETYPWVSLPEQFHQRLEFLGRIEAAEGMMFGVHRLLLQLRTWLTARQCGVTGVVLHWEHDLQRRSEAKAGQHTVHTAQATRDVSHLARLLVEHLARLTLVAPVVAISLEAYGVEVLELASTSLLPEDRLTGESLQQFIERVSARLGPDKVLVGEAVADHRPQRMQKWHLAAGSAGQTYRSKPVNVHAAQASHPPWLLREPVKLAMKGDVPLYLGPLQLLAGPERIEGGWWEEEGEAGKLGAQEEGAAATAGQGNLILRDYFIAQSEHVGLVWIYREREAIPLQTSAAGWYLHGFYG